MLLPLFQLSFLNSYGFKEIVQYILTLGISQSPTQHSQFLYVDSLGWKTAKPHRIEIWFVEHDGKYYVISERKKRAHWVQNILHNPHVSFTVNNESFEGYARVIDEDEPELVSSVSSLMNKKYGWSDGLIVELNPK
jgi:deazaflavin-dependent oxidoreductase (nitroreductase family)